MNLYRNRAAVPTLGGGVISPMPPADNNMTCQCTLLAVPCVPCQTWGKTYEPVTALKRGTLFPELDLPFMGKGAMR